MDVYFCGKHIATIERSTESPFPARHVASGRREPVGSDSEDEPTSSQGLTMTPPPFDIQITPTGQAHRAELLRIVNQCSTEGDIQEALVEAGFEVQPTQQPTTRFVVIAVQDAFYASFHEVARQAAEPNTTAKATKVRSPFSHSVTTQFGLETLFVGSPPK